MVVLRSSFNVFHNLGARNLKDFFPKDVVLTRDNCNLFLPLSPVVLAKGSVEEKNSIHSTKCRGDPQDPRRKYAGPFADMVILAYLKDREFLYTH